MRIQFRLRSAWPGSNFMRQRLGCPAACGVGALPPFHFYASLIGCIDEIYIKDLYKSETLIRPGDTIVDAGANVGMFTLKAASLVGPSGAVIAFEPVKENFRLIKDNIYINNLKNVSIIPKALGDNTGYAKIYLSKSSARHSLAEDAISKSDVLGIAEVEVTTLDNMLLPLKITSISLLKIDVEGLELEVLKGGINCLKITKYVTLEIHNDNEGMILKPFLEANGFSVNIVGNILHAKNISQL